MNPFTIFLLGMLAGLALAYAVMRLGFVIARRRLKTSAFEVGASVSQFVRMCGATATFKEIGAEAKATKADVDAALQDVAVARTPVPNEGT